MNRKSLIFCSYVFFSTLAIGLVAGGFGRVAQWPIAVPTVGNSKAIEGERVDCVALDGELRYRNLPLDEEDDPGRTVLRSPEPRRDASREWPSAADRVPVPNSIRNFETDATNLLYRQLCR